jgi:hypothetical protein
VGGALEEVEVAGAAVEHALELPAHAEGPVHGGGGDAEHAFQLVEQFDGGDRLAVHLVHEGEDGDAALAADLEELAGLGLDALAGVDHHDGGVDGGEDAVGVLGEVLVARGVEQVDDAVAVFELQHGGADGDAALALQLHPVGGGGALVLALAVTEPASWTAPP